MTEKVKEVVVVEKKDDLTKLVEVNTMKTLAERIREGFEQNEGLTWKTLADNMNVTYNMIRAAAKQPTPGMIYDPDEINWNAVAAYLTKVKAPKEVELPDFASIVGKPAPCKMNIDDWKVGMQVTFTNAGGGKTYYNNLFTIKLIEDGYITMKNVKTMKMCSLNFNTFYHQMPKRVEEVR